MKLTDDERAMIGGEAGPVLQKALTYQLRLAEFFGADHFVPVTNAHFTGDFEVMDSGGLAYVEELAAAGAKVRVPTTRNSTCVDPAAAGQLKQRCTLVDGELRVGPMLRRMGVLTVNTCIGYQTVYTPRLGEHVAWGDTGTVAYANSVLGARTNYEAGPASLFAGITGRTAAYGFHLDEHRRANVVCRVDAPMTDLADWGVLGLLVGKRFRGYWNVPVFEFTRAEPTPDALKHLAASIASYGSMAMFHVAGVTPEADDAVGGREVLERIVLSKKDIEDVYAEQGKDDQVVDLVVFTAPQQSLLEVQQIADLLDGRRVHPDVDVILTTNSMVAKAAAEEGLTNVLSRSGAMLLVGTCWYLMDPAEMRESFGWKRLVTNSAKLANIIRAHGYEPVLRRTAECIDAAVSGKVR
ncbi:aconitase X [Amycolatopsis jejuensis]|uniref:aconitase X n=1 Tax=Amycolatopsis jejuensis TaxID=330084 RepID=UPI000524493C|nr:aconitase X catalytic domain-containing protein [Amycolatopsis jejuensis]